MLQYFLPYDEYKSLSVTLYQSHLSTQQDTRTHNYFQGNNRCSLMMSSNARQYNEVSKTNGKACKSFITRVFIFKLESKYGKIRFKNPQMYFIFHFITSLGLVAIRIFIFRQTRFKKILRELKYSGEFRISILLCAVKTSSSVVWIFIFTLYEGLQLK